MKLNKFIIIGLIFGFIVSIIGLLFMASCPKNSITDCLIEKEDLMPDFYWHINTIKYVAANWVLPFQVSEYADLNYEWGLKNVIHAPLYYYIGAVLWNLSEILEINSLFILHLLSILLMLLANVLFFLLVKKVSRHMNFKKQFIIISTLMFIFFPLNLYLSLVIHNHVLFLIFFILSFYLYSKSLENKDLKTSLFLGLSLGFGLLSSLMILPLFLAILFYTFLNYFFNKDKGLKFILFSLVLGSIIGSFTLIRNYLLYGDLVWGGVIASLQKRNFFTLVRVVKAFFSGAYGGYQTISPLIFIVSILIIAISIYGFFIWIVEERKRRFRANAIGLVFLTGIITLVLSFHTVCNLGPLFKDFICFGGDLIHGRHLLPIVPGVVVSFAIGLTNLFKKHNFLRYILVIIICLLYSLDFLYTFID